MAKTGKARPSEASRQASQQRADRVENLEITAAVAATEDEIVDFVTGDDPLELDDDTSLEEMGDGLEGDDDLEDGDDDGDEDGDEGEGEGDGTDEGDLEGEGDLEEGDGDLEDDGQGDQAPLAAERPGIPPGRLREESGRRRTLEAELIEARAREGVLREMLQGRGQPAAPAAPAAPPEPEPEPDQFAFPNEWRAWNAKETKRQIDEGVRAGLATIRQETQQQLLAAANESLDDAANGPRAWEFRPAYDKLKSLPNTPERERLVNRILHSPDPAKAVFAWWEQNGGPEYRQAVAEQLAEQNGWELPEAPAPQRGQRQANGQPSRVPARNQPQGQPRQVFRSPTSMRSLNGANGSARGQQHDPRTLDDSDAAVADYIFAN